MSQLVIDGTGQAIRQRGTASGVAHQKVMDVSSSALFSTIDPTASTWAMGDTDTAITIAAAANDDGISLDLRKVDFANSSIVLIASAESGSVTGVAVTVKCNHDGNWTAGETWTSAALTEVSGATINADGSYMFTLSDAEFPFTNYAKINVAVTGGTSMAFKAYLMAQGRG